MTGKETRRKRWGERERGIEREKGEREGEGVTGKQTGRGIDRERERWRE